MIGLARRASLLVVAFSLLTSAARAYAECAWVLWEEWFSIVGDSVASAKEWEIVGAVDTVATCTRVAGDAAKDRTRRWGNAVATTKIEGNQVTIQSATALFNYRYVCLPDTVDPRGPKGK